MTTQIDGSLSQSNGATINSHIDSVHSGRIDPNNLYRYGRSNSILIDSVLSYSPDDDQKAEHSGPLKIPSNQQVPLDSHTEPSKTTPPPPPSLADNSAQQQMAAAAAAAAAYHLTNMFRKPKRIRTAFSPGQLLRLEEIFEKNRYVVGCERRQLARDLHLSETQIKVWFQNRRTKHKREKHVRSVHGSANHRASRMATTSSYESSAYSHGQFAQHRMSSRLAVDSMSPLSSRSNCSSSPSSFSNHHSKTG